MTIDQINEILGQRKMWVSMAAKRVPRDMAEDMFQDALVLAIQSPHLAKEGKNYFTSILYNQCHEYWRKRTSRAKLTMGVDRVVQMSQEEDKYSSLAAPLHDRVDYQMLLQEEEAEDEERKKWLYLRIGEIKNPHIHGVVMEYIRTGVDDHSNPTNHVRLWRATQRLKDKAKSSGLMRSMKPSTPSGRRSFKAA